MEKELAMKWVEALRSGKYKQGKGYLSRNGEYCCLGILCEIEGQPSAVDSGGHAFFGDAKSRSAEFYPGKALKTRSGNIKKFNVSLAELNDEGKSFSEIADIIEENYEEL